MAGLGLTLGVVALALSGVLAAGLGRPFIEPMTFFVGALVVVGLVVLGLLLSVLGLLRRKGRGIGLPVWAMGVNIVALGVVILAAVIIFSDDEPDFDEAMLQLIQEAGSGIGPEGECRYRTAAV